MIEYVRTVQIIDSTKLTFSTVQHTGERLDCGLCIGHRYRNDVTMRKYHTRT